MCRPGFCRYFLVVRLPVASARAVASVGLFLLFGQGYGAAMLQNGLDPFAVCQPGVVDIGQESIEGDKPHPIDFDAAVESAESKSAEYAFTMQGFSFLEAE
jgi:hypothetical protein